ncbi:MAG: YczE/YyaS/YitT family protein, partial [Actinomycetota bacterium]
PWDVLHDAVVTLTPLSFGQGVIAISVVVMLISVVLGVRPGPGTVSNVILVGGFTDVILATNALAGMDSRGYPLRLVTLLAGIVAIAVGSALYIGADLGAGPRDSLMLAVASLAGVTPGTARAAIEVSVLVLGMVSGGTAGLGTVVFAASIGPAVDAAFRLFRLEPRETRPGLPIWTAHAIKQSGKRGQVGAQPSGYEPRSKRAQAEMWRHKL